MERLEIVFSKTARLQMVKQAAWYIDNRGNDFRQSFENNIRRTIDALAASPGIGRFHKQIGNKTYRSFVTHPRCMIMYWYTAKVLYISRLRFTAMHY